MRAQQHIVHRTCLIHEAHNCLCVPIDSDQHVMSTLSHLLDFYDRQRAEAGLKGASCCICWAHHSYLGDARHTVVARLGEWNVGQSAREQWGLERCQSIGLTTYDGTVSAAK